MLEDIDTKTIVENFFTDENYAEYANEICRRFDANDEVEAYLSGKPFTVAAGRLAECNSFERVPALTRLLEDSLDNWIRSFNAYGCRSADLVNYVDTLCKFTSANPCTTIQFAQKSAAECHLNFLVQYFNKTMNDAEKAKLWNEFLPCYFDIPSFCKYFLSDMLLFHCNINDSCSRTALNEGALKLLASCGYVFITKFEIVTNEMQYQYGMDIFDLIIDRVITNGIYKDDTHTHRFQCSLEKYLYAGGEVQSYKHNGDEDYLKIVFAIAEKILCEEIQLREECLSSGMEVPVSGKITILEHIWLFYCDRYRDTHKEWDDLGNRLLEFGVLEL